MRYSLSHYLIRDHTHQSSEHELSNLTLDGIERELQSISESLADANDIATLAAFPTMPADLDNDSRAALRRLREKVMARTIVRTAV